MPLTSDYHTHPLAHNDGKVYTEKLLSGWINYAKKHGLNEVVFTDHFRYHPGILFDVFQKAKDSTSEVKLLLGVELDNDPLDGKEGFVWAEKNYNQLDYLLGSVHFIDDWAFDRVEEKDLWEQKNVAQTYREYYNKLKEIITTGLPDGLAHLDLIKIFSYFPEEDVSDAVDEVLSLAAKHDMVMEISTAGLHKPVKQIYPSKEIIKKAKEKNIKFTVSSDAHAPQHLGRDFDLVFSLLQEFDIKEIARFEKHKRRMVPV